MAIVWTKNAALITEEEEEEREKWVQHYCSLHQILLVGEGDFSFSLSLAFSFGSASNIVATSLDPYDTVIKKYNKAKSNLQNLENLGAYLLHGVDATKMKLHTDLKMRKFDRIIFNFPHAGFYGKEDNIHLIKMHKDLVQGFFRNASGMLRPDGEIHVNHKITAPFCYWNLGELGSQSSLALIECVDFRIEDYPGYNNKRGAGSRCDDPFPLGECCTFKFRFSPNTKKNPESKKIPNLAHRRPYQLQEIPNQMFRQPNTFSYSSSRTELRTNTNCSPGYMGSPLTHRRAYQLQEMDFLIGFATATATSSLPKPVPSCHWVPPDTGTLKFNVDGSSLGYLGRSGIGGVLRDSNGDILGMFSRSVGSMESNIAELLAIREALVLIHSSLWINAAGITIESHSKSAVAWVNDPHLKLWKLNSVFSEIIGLLDNCIPRFSIHISHTLRGANHLADSLAKSGVGRHTPFLVGF